MLRMQPCNQGSPPMRLTASCACPGCHISAKDSPHAANLECFYSALHEVACCMQVHEATVAAGAYPSPLNYHNFPKSVCTSVNEVRWRILP